MNATVAIKQSTTEVEMIVSDFRKLFEARTQSVELPTWDIAEGEALRELQDLQCRAIARARFALQAS